MAWCCAVPGACQRTWDAWAGLALGWERLGARTGHAASQGTQRLRWHMGTMIARGAV